MTNRHNLVFLCSGGGGNMRFIHALWEVNALDRVKSISVIADRECPATEWSRAHGLETDVLLVNRDNQDELVRMCKSREASLIVTNIHKILAPVFVSEFSDSLLNLHYSILPAFSGLIGAKAVDAAIRYGEKIIGVTAHVVTEVIDDGEPIAQVAFGVSRGDRQAEVMDTMFRAGGLCLFNALQVMLGQKDGLPGASPAPHGTVVWQRDRALLANPCFELPPSVLSEDFWKQVSV